MMTTVATTRTVDGPGSAPLSGQHEEHEHDEPRQLARSEHQAGHHERDQQRGERHLVGEDPDRDPAEHGQRATSSARMRDPRGTTRLTRLSRRPADVGTVGARGENSWSSSSRRLCVLDARLYGAGAERGLTSGAPEDVASDQLGGAHARAAQQAGHRGAAVDVDLSPVVVLARGACPSPRACARAARCRSAPTARPRPSARPGRPTWRATARPAGCCRGAAGGCGAGRGPRRGRRCRPRPAPSGP